METLRNLLKAIRLYMPGIFPVCVIYFLFIIVQQGIDVVIHAGEFFWHGVMGCTGVVLWGFLTWYSLRLLSYACQGADHSSSQYLPTSYHQLLPRLIAYNCMVSVQAAIFNITVFNFNDWYTVLFIAAHNVFYFILSPRLSGNTKSPAALVCGLIYVAILIYEMFINRGYAVPDHTARYKFWLFVVALFLFFFEVLALWFFIRRRKRIDEQISLGVQKEAKGGINRLKLNDKYTPFEMRYFNVFHLIITGATLIYLAAIFMMKMAIAMGPMAFVVLALGVLSGFFALVNYFSIRVRFSLMLVILFVAIIIGKFSDPYDVRLTYTDQEKQFAKRPDLRAFLHQWIKVREAQLNRLPDKGYKSFIVLSNGGASRAGNWVCNVLSGLQDSSMHAQQKNPFSDHLLFMAGASGGSVGNCAFYSLLKENRTAPVSSFSEHAGRYFAGDFLTYTLGRMLGPDFFRHIFPLKHIDDRAAALSHVIANGSKDEVINKHMGNNISQKFDYSGHLPVLIINTTRVNDGMPGVISTIQLPKSSQRIDVLKLLDSLSVSDKHDGDMTMSTAAVLSARFPYVSPAGCILNNYFVDGGYFDNSGAGIILEYMEELDALLKDTSDAYLQQYGKKLSFYVLHLTNSAPSATQPHAIAPLVNDLFTPLLTLGNMQGSTTKVGNGLLKKYFINLNANRDSSVYDLGLYKPYEEQEEYPMSWVISDYQLNRMKQRSDQVVRENYWRIR